MYFRLNLSIRYFMKRRLVFWVLLLFLAAGGIWYLVFRQSGMYRVREGIPEDAVFIVETPSFNRIRDKLYRESDLGISESISLL